MNLRDPRPHRYRAAVLHTTPSPSASMEASIAHRSICLFRLAAAVSAFGSLLQQLYQIPKVREIHHALGSWQCKLCRSAPAASLNSLRSF
jgi:hypothetical protein